MVFLLDQSGSMSGANGADATDPTKQRTYASQWAVDWLTDNALDICPQAIHRIAVISFGSQANLDLELSNVDPNNEAEATRIRERLKPRILPQDLGETNPQRAFQMAKQVLDDAAPIGDMPRKRVIIFMTDGHPCVERLGCTPPKSTMDFVSYANEMSDWVIHNLPFDAALLKQEQCQQEARATYGVNAVPADVSTKCLADFRASPDAYSKSTYIWTLLLKHGSAYSNQLRDAYVRMSAAHAGEVINLTENRADIPTNFLNILSQLAGVKAQSMSCGYFAVNPYLRQMRLILFKVAAETPVTLEYVDAKGETHRAKNGQGDAGFTIAEHGLTGPNERYVIDNPYPGIWHFFSDDCTGLNAYYEPLEIAVGGTEKPLQILAPGNADPTRLRDSDKFYLQYTMRGTNGISIQQAEPPLFAVRFTVEAVDPKGGKQSYEMEWLPEKKIFQSKDWLKLPFQGEYEINISAEASNRDFPYYLGTTIQDAVSVYSSKRQLFTYSEKFKAVCPNAGSIDMYPWPEDMTLDADGCDVLPVRDFNFVIAEPDADESLPIHGTLWDGWPLPIRPIEFEVNLVDAKGEELSPTGVVDNIAHPFSITLAAGNQNINVTYQQDPNNSSRYNGTISGLNTSGKHELTVNLASGNAKFYEPLNHTASQTFNRQDGIWNTSRTYYGLLTLLILMAIAFVAYQIAIRNNKVNGTLVFRAGNIVISSFALGGGKNWKDLARRELSKKQELDLVR
ncbi:MAG: VWA domain-containing protein, partial [Methylobacter sp.]|nr:VWA domain-containing protein [Methylobacter sp.]